MKSFTEMIGSTNQRCMKCSGSLGLERNLFASLSLAWTGQLCAFSFLDKFTRSILRVALSIAATKEGDDLRH